MERKRDRSLKNDLEILLEKSKISSTLSVKEILETLPGKSRSLILIFLSLPFCQPIQIPGLSTPFGILIALIGLRIAFGKRILLPKRILIKTISSITVQKITQKILKLMCKMKRFIHPRLEFLCDRGKIQTVNGLLIFLLGILLALPIPIPLTNLVAGWSIFLLNLGLFESDGFFVIIGYLASLITIAFFVLILFSIGIVF